MKIVLLGAKSKESTMFLPYKQAAQYWNQNFRNDPQVKSTNKTESLLSAG